MIPQHNKTKQLSKDQRTNLYLKKGLHKFQLLVLSNEDYLAFQRKIHINNQIFQDLTKTIIQIENNNKFHQ